MPIHNWKGVYAGLFHHFHQAWVSAICRQLNRGGLPQGYYALAEQYTPEKVPDTLALQRSYASPQGPPGTVLIDAEPKTRFRQKAEEEGYASRADHIIVRHPMGEIVAVIELVSPGNKSSLGKIEEFVDKTVNYIAHGVHVLVVDILPPTPRDPHGMHALIWDHFSGEEFELPPDKPLTLASYAAGDCKEAFVEPVAVGDLIPDMPLFLTSRSHVLVSLEKSYTDAWEDSPALLHEAVLRQIPPNGTS